MQEATEYAVTASGDASRYQRAEEDLRQALEIARGFSLDTQPICSKAVWLRGTRAPGGVAAAGAGGTPKRRTSAGAASEPGAAAAETAGDRQAGTELLEKARIELSKGEVETARRLAVEVYNGPYDLKAQADAVLHSIDAEEYGQRVLAAMQDGVLNLCRVKLRDQQRLARTGVMQEYPQYPDGKFGSAVPRAGNASGGGQPGWIIKCKGWETDPNAYLYFITQAPVWKEICNVIGKEEWITHPDYATPNARLPRLKEVFATVEAWTMQRSKFEAMAEFNKHDIPCGPILSMEELAAEPSLRATGTVVEVDHPKRGQYLTVGNPIKLSDSPTEVKRSPLLGEHTAEVLSELGLSDAEIASLRKDKVI